MHRSSQKFRASSSVIFLVISLPPCHLERSFFYDLLPWSDSLPDNFRKHEPKSVCAIKFVSNPISFRAVFIKTDAVYGAFTIFLFSLEGRAPFYIPPKNMWEAEAVPENFTVEKWPAPAPINKHPLMILWYDNGISKQNHLRRMSAGLCQNRILFCCKWIFYKEPLWQTRKTLKYQA